jgi:hypothetical protein
MLLISRTSFIFFYLFSKKNLAQLAAIKNATIIGVVPVWCYHNTGTVLSLVPGASIVLYAITNSILGTGMV